MRKVFARKTRVYSQRSYQNPFFKRRRRRVETMPIKKKLYYLGTTLIVVFSFWFIFYNDYFLVQDIEVQGSVTIAQNAIYGIIDNQLDKKRLFFFNQSNLFSFSKSQAKKEILKQYYVEDLKIKKRLRDKLIVQFKEKQAVAVWLEDDVYYYIDNDLNLIAEAQTLDIDLNDYIVLTDAEKNIQINTDGLTRYIKMDRIYLDFALSIARQIRTTDIKNSRTFSIKRSENTLNMGVINGPVIYFNTSNDIDTQFTYLKTLYEEKIKGEDNLLKLKYIDLRFGEKLYYK